MKKKKPVGERVCWTIAIHGEPLPFYATHTRRGAIGAFEENLCPLPNGDRNNIKNYPLYKPVKVLMKIIK